MEAKPAIPSHHAEAGVNMTSRELVRTITNRLKPGTVMNDTTIKLGAIFWPVSRSENLAFKFWPQYFKVAAA